MVHPPELRLSLLLRIQQLKVRDEQLKRETFGVISVTLTQAQTFQCFFCITSMHERNKFSTVDEKL